MKKDLCCAVAALGLIFSSALWAQASSGQQSSSSGSVVSAQSPASKTASSPSAIPTPKAASPIQTQFKAFKLMFLANGKEELEPASSVSTGDVVEYVAVHRNVSQRRLLNVDFSIPIPYGTTLWQGSVWPENGQLRMPDLALKDGKANPQTNGSAMAKAGEQGVNFPRVVWHIDRLDPGQSVQLKLRVSIDPDPTLAPAPAPNPFRPSQPQLRKP